MDPENYNSHDNYNEVSDSDSNKEEEKEENIFESEINDEFEVIPKTTLN